MHAGHLCLAGSIILGVAGQMLFRAATAETRGLAALLSWTAFGGCALYGLSTVLYLLALQRLPISIAMPTLACGYILVAIFGWWRWHEPFAAVQAVGLVLIVLGVGLLHLPGMRSA
jgi:undecaprenyl phosphate-alpha-L-ara4N flippase subunit ArnE